MLTALLRKSEILEEIRFLYSPFSVENVTQNHAQHVFNLRGEKKIVPKSHLSV